jgi:hypothetical protein
MKLPAFSRLYSFTTQKSVIFIVTTVRSSNPTLLTFHGSMGKSFKIKFICYTLNSVLLHPVGSNI